MLCIMHPQNVDNLTSHQLLTTTPVILHYKYVNDCIALLCSELWLQMDAIQYSSDIRQK